MMGNLHFLISRLIRYIQAIVFMSSYFLHILDRYLFIFFTLVDVQLVANGCH